MQIKLFLYINFTNDQLVLKAHGPFGDRRIAGVVRDSKIAIILTSAGVVRDFKIARILTSAAAIQS